MKSLPLVLVALIAPALATAAPVTAEAGIAYAAVSGVRPYAAPDLRHSDTSGVVAPFIRVSTAFSPEWRIGLAYSFLTSLKGSGVSSDTNIFKTPNIVAAQVITPFRSSEDIHELALDFRYAMIVSNELSFQVGPVASLYLSKAEIATRSFSSTELKIGAVAELRYDVNDKWQLALGCRYSRPTDRKITQVYFSAGCRL